MELKKSQCQFVAVFTNEQLIVLKNPASGASFECFLFDDGVQAIDKESRNPVQFCLVDVIQNGTVVERGFTDFRGRFLIQKDGDVKVYRSITDVVVLNRTI